MKRTIQEVLEELQTDFTNIKIRVLQAYLNEDNRETKNLKKRVKWLITDYMIPELKELSELLDD